MKIQSQRHQSRESCVSILYQVELRDIEELDAIYEYEFQRLEDLILKVEKNKYARQKLYESICMFCVELVDGTCEHIQRIDEIIRKYSANWEFDRIACIDKVILRYSIYELLFIDSIPALVSINEAIDISKKYSTEKSGKFINGILDKIYTDRDSLINKTEGA